MLRCVALCGVAQAASQQSAQAARDEAGSLAAALSDATSALAAARDEAEGLRRDAATSALAAAGLRTQLTEASSGVGVQRHINAPHAASHAGMQADMHQAVDQSITDAFCTSGRLVFGMCTVVHPSQTLQPHTLTNALI